MWQNCNRAPTVMAGLRSPTRSRNCSRERGLSFLARGTRWARSFRSAAIPPRRTKPCADFAGKRLILRRLVSGLAARPQSYPRFGADLRSDHLSPQPATWPRPVLGLAPLRLKLLRLAFSNPPPRGANRAARPEPAGHRGSWVKRNRGASLKKNHRKKRNPWRPVSGSGGIEARGQASSSSRKPDRFCSLYAGATGQFALELIDDEEVVLGRVIEINVLYRLRPAVKLVRSEVINGEDVHSNAVASNL
jgi:hypothetical protein